MIFKDKNGKEINIGDQIKPDVMGMILQIVSERYVEDIEQECLFGQQVENPLAFSLLTQEDLSKQWTLIKK